MFAEFCDVTKSCDLLNIVFLEDTLPEKLLHNLFDNESTIDTGSITLDDSIHSKDMHECHGIYGEHDMDEKIYEILVPKARDPKNKSLVPISIAMMDTIGLVVPRKLLKELFDLDSTTTMIKASAVPDKAIPEDMKEGEMIYHPRDNENQSNG